MSGISRFIPVSSPRYYNSYWRSDIKCSADLVEEVVRIIGYEKIPITRLSSPLPSQKSKLSPAIRQRDFKDKLRNILTGFGFQEILTYSLVSLKNLQNLSPNLKLKTMPLKVANPMTREQEYLRITLRAGLLSTLAHNQKFESAGIRLFEIGKVFLPQHPPVIASEAKQSQVERELPKEKEMLCAVNPHPNADRLKLATVELGTEQITIVCGAPNVRVGQKVPFAHVGARLINGHTGEAMSLKPAKIRGVVSAGMICSEKELGISENHEEILVLPPDAPIGMALSAYLGDVIFDLDITPNRPDCLSVIGIAREIAALTGEPLRLPEIHYTELEDSIGSFASVDIAEPNLCPRYCASLITGIKIAPSPSWLQRRLNSYGMRPINNVVDITNYVMLEYGQPLHAFDYHKLKGKQIIVRRAGNGETITSLDGTKRTLSSDILVIADKEEAVAVAGIIGGLNSEVTDKTDTILLESANFDQAVIHRGCGYLQLQSEASVRFGKGLNSELPPLPLKRATQLILELAGGRAAKGVIDVYPGKSAPKLISLTAREVERLSGLKVNIAEVIKVLKALGFECQESNSDLQISTSSPYWRSDIKCSADLVEEVVRIIGYEKIPITRLSSPLPSQKSKLSPAIRQRDFKDKLRNILTGFGFQEILTYSLVSLKNLLTPGG